MKLRDLNGASNFSGNRASHMHVTGRIPVAVIHGLQEVGIRHETSQHQSLQQHDQQHLFTATMTMTMTLREVRETMSEARCHECRGHDHPKKNLSKLMGLALLARFVLAHGQMTACSTLDHKEKHMGKRNTGCCWYKFSEFRSLEPSDSVQRNEGGQGNQENHEESKRKSVSGESNLEVTLPQQKTQGHHPTR